MFSSGDPTWRRRTVRVGGADEDALRRFSDLLELLDTGTTVDTDTAARRLARDPDDARAMLSALQAHGFVDVDGRDLRLGSRALELGRGAGQRLPERVLGAKVLRDLVGDGPHSGGVWVRRGRLAICVTAHGHGLAAGDARPLARDACGAALLAPEPAELWASLTDGPASCDAVLACRLQGVRDRGWLQLAVGGGDVLELGAPVFSDGGRVVAAITVTMPSIEIDRLLVACSSLGAALDRVARVQNPS